MQQEESKLTFIIYLFQLHYFCDELQVKLKF